MTIRILGVFILFLGLSSPSTGESFWWWGDPDKPDVFRSESHKELYEQLNYYKGMEDLQENWTKLEIKKLPAGAGLLQADQLKLLTERLKLYRDLKEVKEAKASTPQADSKNKIAEITAALKSFQTRHALEPTGLIDTATLEALNRPLSQRIEQIRASLKGWEQLPEELGANYILVNIPEFVLRAYKGSQLALESRVIVGKEYKSETPAFSGLLKSVIFRPYWNIPHSIVMEEIYEKAKEDPSYLERNAFELVESFGPDSEMIEPTEENITKLETGELNLRQRSGPGNSLGLVKFRFPNKYAVYLHDTPAQHLFQKEKRDFSHGCVRVEKPAELASYVLSIQDKSWTLEKARRAMNTDKYKAIGLKNGPMVHLTYQLVTVGEGGQLHFHKDIYGKLDSLQGEGSESGASKLTASNE